MICGDCNDIVVKEAEEEANQFKCQKCGKKHVMPSEGLINATAIMQTLQVQPEEKVLSDQAKKLQSTINRVLESVTRMETVDHAEVINAYAQ